MKDQSHVDEFFHLAVEGPQPPRRAIVVPPNTVGLVQLLQVVGQVEFAQCLPVEGAEYLLLNCREWPTVRMPACLGPGPGNVVVESIATPPQRRFRLLRTHTPDVVRP